MTIRTALLLALLSQPAVAATHELKTGTLKAGTLKAGTWLSVPRAAISIVVDAKGAYIAGPDWRRQFTPAADKPIRIDLDENSWFVLRLRADGAWEGTYYHPAVRPEEHGQFKRHLMLLTRE